MGRAAIHRGQTLPQHTRQVQRHRDSGLTLVEAVLAIALTSVAIAASAVAVSAASNVRSATIERSLAARLAEVALAEAEVSGCGLPARYDATLPRHASQICSTLLEADRVLEADGYRFDMDVTTSWHLLDPLNKEYLAGSDDCERRAGFARGEPSSPPNPSIDPPPEGVATVLVRKVTVTSQRAAARTVALTSLEAVLPHLAPDGWSCP